MEIYNFIIILIIVFIIFIILNNILKKFENFTENNKIAVITSIYGNYDKIKDQKNVLNRNLVDWYCFTDNNNIKSNYWNIINTPYHIIDTKNNEKIVNFKNYYKNINDKKIYNMMCAKYYKSQMHKIDILKKYKYYIWIDGSIFLRDNFIKNIIIILNKNYNLINFKHSSRNNIKNETKVSILLNKYKSQNILEQYNIYIKNNFPDNIGLFEKTIFVRKNNLKINDLFDLWWEHNLKYSYQDQISYPYVLWKKNIIPDYIIEENVFNNKNYSFTDQSLNGNHVY
jgi:hypothetical protein